MGLITNLIGNVSRTKMEESRMRDSEIQRRLALDQHVMADEYAKPEAKQLAQQDIMTLLGKHGGAEGKKHAPMISTMLSTLAGAGKAMAGVPSQPQLPESPLATLAGWEMTPEQQKAHRAEQFQEKLGEEEKLSEMRQKQTLGTYQKEKDIDAQAFEAQQKKDVQWFDENREKLKKAGWSDKEVNDAQASIMMPKGVKLQEPKREILKVTDEQGTPHYWKKDTAGNYYDESNTPVNLPAGWNIEGKVGVAKAAATDKDLNQLTQRLIKSGQVTDPAEAEKQAAGILANMQKNKQGAAAGAQLNPQQLSALAQYDLLTGKTTSFGMGANNPNRTAYQAARADILAAGGPRSVAEQAASQKSDTGSLASLVKMTDAVDAWEKNAKLNLDQVLKTGQQVGRTGSSLANEYQQYLAGKLEDYPALAKFRVAVETAAAEYTKVMYSPTASGGTAKDQREASHGMLNTAMAEGALEGAVEQMNIDMDNRHNTLHEQIGNVQQRMRGGAAGGGKGGGAGAGAAGGPKKGDRQTHQGADYVFDGTQWVRQ